jgi:hypothetical protein
MSAKLGFVWSSSSEDGDGNINVHILGWIGADTQLS